MAIDLLKSKVIKKESSPKEQQIENYFQNSTPKKGPGLDPIERERLLIEEYAKEAILRWRTPEFEGNNWSQKWKLVATAILAIIVIYALILDNFMMAVTFILIGIVGYLFINKKPRILDFMINHQGILAGTEIYDFKNIQSFWIFYEPRIKTISLRMKEGILPHIHIPLGDEDPVKIREALIQFIPEEEQEMTFIDIIERFLKI